MSQRGLVGCVTCLCTVHDIKAMFDQTALQLTMIS